MRRLLLLLVLLGAVVINAQAQDGYRYAKRGYFGAVNLNCIVWDDNSSVGVGAEVINGYSFNKWFMLGAGVGANLMPYKGYKNEQVIEALIPIFVHTRFNILDRRVTPFFSLSIGGGILVDNYNKGASSSIYLDPKLGVAVRLKSGKMVDIGISRLFGGGIWIGPYNGIKFGVSYVW